MHMGRDHSSPGMEIQGQDGSMSRVRVSKDGNVVHLTSVLVQQQLVFSVFFLHLIWKKTFGTSLLQTECPSCYNFSLSSENNDSGQTKH